MYRSNEHQVLIHIIRVSHSQIERLLRAPGMPSVILRAPKRCPTFRSRNLRWSHLSKSLQYLWGQTNEDSRTLIESGVRWRIRVWPAQESAHGWCDDRFDLLRKILITPSSDRLGSINIIETYRLVSSEKVLDRSGRKPEYSIERSIFIRRKHLRVMESDARTLSNENSMQHSTFNAKSTWVQSLNGTDYTNSILIIVCYSLFT